MAYDVARAVGMMHIIAVDWSVGYTQGTGRWNIRDGGECDCSSAVSWAVNSGFDEVVLDHATYTGNLRVRLSELGFQVLPGSTAPKVGDVVLAEGHHVAMCTAPGVLAEAWINEHGRITGGQSGDQTGGETREVAYQSHTMTIRGAWTHVLRPPTTTVEAAPAASTTSEIGDPSMRLIHTITPWGAHTWAEITEHAGADGLDQLGCAIEQKVWGAPSEVTWDEYSWHVTRAWQRAARVSGMTADEVTKRVEVTLPKQEA